MKTAGTTAGGGGQGQGHCPQGTDASDRRRMRQKCRGIFVAGRTMRQKRRGIFYFCGGRDDRR
jgi:hypothetical protein